MSNPSWLESAVFYNIYPQSFFDSNNDGIGDLRGITQKLDYVRDMGFSAIWLNPFYESPFRDAGYDVTDFYKVAQRYGNNSDFKNLCVEAHKRGIKVCIDLVIGHTSLECEWFKKSCLPEKNEFSNRYIWTDQWEKNYKGNCIGGYGQRDGMYMKNFFYCQPALNYGFANIDDPSWQLPPEHEDCVATKNEMKKIMEYWIALGADGFRVDMASSIIKNDYDYSATIKFWNEIRAMFDEKYPECVLISEWSDPSYAIKAGFHIDFLIHFFSPAYTMLFRAEKGRNCNDIYLGDSFFNKDGNGDIEDFLFDYLRHYESTKGKGYISLPTGNHDLPRISYRRDKKEIEIVYAFILTMPGIPFVYYGDEIGMSYMENLPSKEGGFNRTGARTPMQWSNDVNAGFSKADKKDLYLPVEEDSVNVQDQLNVEDSLLNTTKNLIKLRKSSRALCADGDIEFLNRKYNGYPLVYKRASGEDEYIICINPTDKKQEFAFDFNLYSPVIKNDSFISDGKKIELNPTSYVIFKKNI